MEKCHSVKDAIKYCKKEDTRMAGPWEHGDAPVNQGKRTDLDELYTLLRQKRPLGEIIEGEPSYARYEKSIKFMKLLLGQKASNRVSQQVKVYAFYGGTGFGKTYAALFLMDDPNCVFKMNPPGKNGQLWFDMYDGERTMVFDEFEGDNFCDMRTLNNLLDVYSLRLPVKGSHVFAEYTTVIICSNTPPRGWYQVNPMEAERLIAPLKRRIYQIRNFIAYGTYVIEDWDGNVISDQVCLLDHMPPVLPPPPLPVQTVPSPLPVQANDEPSLMVGPCDLPSNLVSNYSEFDDTLDSVFRFDE